MESHAEIIVSEDGATLQGRRLPSKIDVATAVGILGEPQRIVEGASRAPAGFFNNEIYFFDNYGVYWIRDHKTRLMRTLGAVLNPDSTNPLQRCTSSPFTGSILLLGCRIDRSTTVDQLSQAVRAGVHPSFGAWWSGNVAGHDITMCTRALEGIPNGIAHIEIAFGRSILKAVTK
jgi:hypothetical protein